MVPEITIFELHFDGARFGPTTVGDDGETDETGQAEKTASRSPLPGLVALIGLAVAMGLLARRRRRTDDASSVEIEVSEGETAEVAR
ncbi:MAG: hypothetical protein ACLFMX_02870 [Halobacteriales archaeon]